MKKRVWSTLLILCMALTLLPFGAFAVEDFSPFVNYIGDQMLQTQGTMYGTFFDFDEDGNSELILVYPKAHGGARVEVTRAEPGTDKDGHTYCNINRVFSASFEISADSGECLAAITVNDKDEVGLLLHSEAVYTSSEGDYQGLIGPQVSDQVYTFRDGKFQSTGSAYASIWQTEEDKDGNAYYYPDLCEFRVNGSASTEKKYNAWVDKFTKSTEVILWLSTDEELDGLNEEELLSLATTGFYDVHYAQYYAKAVTWAAANGVTNGKADYAFAPDDDCTRGQIVTFLWRAAGSPDPKSTKNPFGDVKKDAYYYKAVLWAVEQGITNGTSDKTFSPNDPCTRGQVVTFLYRNAGTPAVKAKNPFKDVKSGAYFYDAVLWAVKNEITNGTSGTTFSPSQACTRGQIVTFLYRGLAK